MIKANNKDRALIVDILSKSFDANKSVNYVIKLDKNRHKRIRRLMEYSFDLCLEFGNVFLNKEKNACALILLPHTKKATLKAILLDAKLGLTCIGLERAMKVLGRESSIKKHHPETPFMYLWFIGVDPKAQGNGYGTALIEEVLHHYKKQGLPTYLETSTQTNIPWYQKLGFEIFQEIDFTYKLYMLRRI